MVFRYDINNNKTFISTRIIEESNLDARLLMKDLVKGGRFPAMGGGFISELIFPDQFFAQFN